MKILLLPFAPITNAGARYRIYKLAPYLEKASHSCVILPPVSDLIFKVFYRPLFVKPRSLVEDIIGTQLRKLYYAIVMFNRKRQIRRWAKWADLAIVQRELYRPGNLGLEELLRSQVRSFIWDFDDALYATDVFGKNGHVNKVIAMSDGVIAGNDALADYVHKTRKQVMVMPTCIDQERYLSKDYSLKSEKTIIGWAGNPFNLRHFEIILPVLQRICAKYPQVVVRLNSIGHKLVLTGVRVEYLPWTLEKELDDLKNFDIGIMPLIDNEYTRGKCGFKLIQYMAVGLPTVSSPVGINARIIDNGENGFLARTNDEWVDKLSRLIDNAELRQSMGLKARQKALREYSLEMNASRLVEFIEGFTK